MTDPLAQLRDIHTPDPVSWWPLATGWWLLLLLLVLLIVALLWLRKVRRAKRLAQQQQALDYRPWAVAQLQLYYADWQQHQNKREFLQQAQTLLRRVALERERSEEVTTLTGEAWCRWLYQQGQQSEFIDGVGQVLATGSYQPNPDYDVTALYELLVDWVYRQPQQTSVNQSASEARHADV